MFNFLGPGYYEATKATTEKGDYFISRFHNSGAAIIGKDKERFKTLTCIDLQLNN